MVGLLDIHPQSEQVAINAKDKVEVFGISAKGIAILLSRFPYLLGVMTAQKDAQGNAIKIAPEAIAAIGAAGLRHPGEEDYEDWVGNLDVSVQLRILEAVAHMTFPEGFGPFVERLKVLSGQASAQVNAAAVDGKVPDGISPSPSPHSKATASQRSGTSRRAK